VDRARAGLSATLSAVPRGPALELPHRGGQLRRTEQGRREVGSRPPRTGRAVDADGHPEPVDADRRHRVGVTQQLGVEQVRKLHDLLGMGAQQVRDDLIAVGGQRIGVGQGVGLGVDGPPRRSWTTAIRRRRRRCPDLQVLPAAASPGVALHEPASGTRQFGGTLFEQGALLVLDALP
jgi:hypothetical protein